MKSILFYDAKEYEKPWFEKYNAGKYAFDYIESKLDSRTVALAEGYAAVCIFVNDVADAAVVRALKDAGIKLILLRCTGYNNVEICRRRNGRELRSSGCPLIPLTAWRNTPWQCC